MGKKSRTPRSHPPLSREHSERVDRAWDALEEGHVEEAGLDAEELMDETDEHPEVRFLFGAALLESGVPGEALEHLLACSDLVEDPVVHRFYLASAARTYQMAHKAAQREIGESLVDRVLA